MTDKNVYKNDKIIDVCEKLDINFVEIKSILLNYKSYTPIKDKCLDYNTKYKLQFILRYDKNYKISCKFNYSNEKLSSIDETKEMFVDGKIQNINVHYEIQKIYNLGKIKLKEYDQLKQKNIINNWKLYNFNNIFFRFVYIGEDSYEKHRKYDIIIFEELVIINGRYYKFDYCLHFTNDINSKTQFNFNDLYGYYNENKIINHDVHINYTDKIYSLTGGNLDKFKKNITKIVDRDEQTYKLFIIKIN